MDIRSLKTTTAISLLTAVALFLATGLALLGAEPLGPWTIHGVAGVGAGALLAVVVQGAIAGGGSQVTTKKLLTLYLMWSFVLAIPGAGVVAGPMIAFVCWYGKQSTSEDGPKIPASVTRPMAPAMFAAGMMFTAAWSYFLEMSVWEMVMMLGDD